MANDKTPPPAPLIRTDAKGIQWGYEPDQDRWFAIVNGKKTSSKEFSKVHDKASALSASVSTPASTQVKLPASPSVLDLPLIAIERDRIFPILGKVEWSAAKGQHELLRYKEFKADGKATEGGWLSSHADRLTVLHPDCLSDGDKAMLVARLATQDIRRVLAETSDRIHATWIEDKAPGRTTYTHAYQAGVTSLVKTDRPDKMSSRRQAHTSPLWPHVATPSETPDLTGWTPTPEGAYRRGEVTLRMGPTEGAYVIGPSFEVVSDRWDNVLYSGKFRDALVLANATDEILAAKQAPIREWRGTDPAYSHSASAKYEWPSLWEIMGGAVVSIGERFSSSLEAFALGQPLESPLSPPDQRYSREPTGVAWHSLSSGIPRFFEASPDDKILEEWDAAQRLAFEHLVQEGQAQAETTTKNWWRASNCIHSPPSAWTTQADMLRAVIGLHDDDPEAMIKDPAQLAARFQREMTRLERQAVSSPAHTACVQKLEALPRAHPKPTRGASKP